MEFDLNLYIISVNNCVGQMSWIELYVLFFFSFTTILLLSIFLINKLIKFIVVNKQKIISCYYDFKWQ